MTDTEKLEIIKKWLIKADLSLKAYTGNLSADGYTVLFQLRNETEGLEGPNILKMLDELFLKISKNQVT